MAKIKTFFHQGTYKISYENYLFTAEKKKQKDSEIIEQNMQISDKKDNEINEFIMGKKVIGITTTLQITSRGQSSITQGYVTTILYEDE